MKDRIEKIIRDEGITSSKFAEEIGIQRSSISHILSGRNKPSLDVFQRILRKYPNINSDWLILGIGKMYKDSTNNSNTEQKDIFSEIQDNENKDVQISEIEDIENEELEVNPINSVNNKKSIEKIIIFYTDKTFDIYK